MTGVRQLHSTGCGPAVVATVARVSYETAIETIFGGAKRRSFRSGWSQISRALDRLGVRHDRRPYRCRSFADIDGTAIVGVNRTASGTWHWVVFRRVGSRACVLDPNSLRRGRVRTDFHRLRPFTAIRVEP